MDTAPPAPRRRRSRVLGNLALALGSTLVVVILAEVAVRTWNPVPRMPHRFSPKTLYEPVPGATFTYQRREFRQEIRYTALGLRDRPLDPAKPPGVRRVLVIGDSFAEALEVALDESFSRRLEAELDRLGSPAEVVNLGVSGYSTVQALRRLDALGWRFAPDDVVYLAHPNDFADNVSGDASALYTVSESGSLTFRDLEVPGIERRLRSVHDWLKRRSSLYQLARAGRLGRSPRPPEPGVGEDARDARGVREPIPDRQRDIMAAALQTLAAACDAHGARLWVTMATAKDPAAAARDRRQTPVSVLAGLASEVNVPFVDLRPTFRSPEAARGRAFFEIDGHWNAIGHRLAARDVARALVGGGRRADDRRAPARDGGGASTPTTIADDRGRPGVPDAALPPPHP